MSVIPFYYENTRQVKGEDIVRPGRKLLL